MRKRAGKKRFRIHNLFSKEITLAIISIVAILALVFLFSSETFVGKAGQQPDCGNGILEFGEECDEGLDNGDEDSSCSSWCEIWDECKEVGFGSVELTAKDDNGNKIAGGYFGSGVCFGGSSYLINRCFENPVRYSKVEISCKNNEQCIDTEIPCNEGEEDCGYSKDGKWFYIVPECVPLNPNCGNRILDEGEDCDDPAGDSSGLFKQNCNGLGFPGGLIKCTNLCKYDVSECNPMQGEKCAEVSSGLVSWWPLEGNANDLTGKNKGYIETLVYSKEGGIHRENKTGNFTLGKVGKSFNFVFDSGEDDQDVNWLVFPDDASLTPAQISLSTWIKLDEDNFGGLLFFKGQTLGYAEEKGYYGNFSWFIINSEESVSFVVQHQGGSVSSVEANYFLSKKVWHHLAATFDQQELKIYLGGSLVATEKAVNNEPLAKSGGNLLLAYGGIAIWVGSIDEIVLWDRALSAEEVKAIYDAHNLGMCAYTPIPISNAVDQSAAGAIGTTAAGNVAGTTYPGSAAVNSGAGTDSTAATVNKPVVGKKITMIDSVPANNIFLTKITATEDFTTEITVYTILYGENNKVLSIKLEKVIGGLKMGTSYNAVVNYPQENIKKKTVIVYDKESDPKVYCTLERAYT